MVSELDNRVELVEKCRIGLVQVICLLIAALSIYLLAIASSSVQKKECANDAMSHKPVRVTICKKLKKVRPMTGNLVSLAFLYSQLDRKPYCSRMHQSLYCIC